VRLFHHRILLGISRQFIATVVCAIPESQRRRHRFAIRTLIICALNIYALAKQYR
jgi:hypothetical protein